MSEILNRINNTLSEIFFGPPTVFLMLAVGIFISVKTGFIQRLLPQAFMLLFSKNKGERLPLGAVCTSLCATVGTGSIAGTAVAISVGGRGAVFWIWASSIVTMGLSFAEGALSVLYQQKKGDKIYGGAMHYMEKGTGSESYAKVFSFLCIISAFCMGNMAQSRAVSDAFEPMNLSGLAVGVILFFISFAVINRRGLKITDFCQRLLPFAATIFVIFCLVIIFIFSYKLPSAIRDIFLEAFGIRGVSGGVSYIAIKRAAMCGFKRGVFSSEAGLGTTCCIHAECSLSPKNAGLMAMLENFIDSFVITTLCALTIILTDTKSVTEAFCMCFGKSGSVISAVCVFLFAFATITGWFYIAKSCADYLNFAFLKKALRIVYPIFCIVGATLSLDFVFTLSDTVNGILAILNISAVMYLSRDVFSAAKGICSTKPFTDDIKKYSDKNARHTSAYAQNGEVPQRIGTRSNNACHHKLTDVVENSAKR